MKDTIVVAGFETGFESDMEPFLIKNDAFPVLQNAFLYRKRIKKKRGTTYLGRLGDVVTAQSIGSTDGSGNLSVPSLFSGAQLTMFPNISINPGSVVVTIGADIFTEATPASGKLTGSSSGTGRINYITGSLTISGGPATTAATVSYSTFANDPVMGLEDLTLIQNLTTNIQFPTAVHFNTKLAYQINQATNIYHNVSFYKQTGNAFNWNGADWQQFFTISYEGAMWTTNNVPGFHIITISGVTSGGSTEITTSSNHNLSNNDWVFINEVEGIEGLNGFSGQVSLAVGNTFTLSVTTTGAYTGGGIVQYMTQSHPQNSSYPDGIKWYDGDPTASANAQGWVNFAPPLSAFSSLIPGNTSIPEYLVGAKSIIFFQDRLLFCGCWLQKSSDMMPNYYPNMIVYSQNGTPYYSNPLPSTLQQNSNPDPIAYSNNSPGKGGDISAPTSDLMLWIKQVGDILVSGYDNLKLKLIYTGNDASPFYFQTINTEYGDNSTFSAVTVDQAILSIGPYGLMATNQIVSKRADLIIPDQIFDISGSTQTINGVQINGFDRITALRDFRNNFVYFTYLSDDNLETGYFPNRTMFLNYLDNTWAIIKENFTHYGTFRRTSGYTWGTLPFSTWSTWTNAWNFGGTASNFPDIIGGNQQGFVLVKADTTQEAQSQYISAINTSTFQVTSPNHNLADGDYILIQGVVGITNLNGQIFQIKTISGNFNLFSLILSTSQTLNPPVGDYSGGGTYSVLSNYKIQSKAFAPSWNQSRQTRFGIQKVLIDNSPGEPTPSTTFNIYTSQNDTFASNEPLVSESLIFTDVMLVGPEPNQLYQINQNQIWHRAGNSFIGDTIQFGFSLSDAQMRDAVNAQADIIIHAVVIDIYPGPVLA